MSASTAKAKPVAAFADYSLLSTFAECARKGYYRYEMGLNPTEPSAPLHAGKALHAGLDVLHMENWALDTAIDAFREAWGDFSPAPASKHSFLTRGHCEIILENYAEDRRNDPIRPFALTPDLLRMEKVEHMELVVDERGLVRLAETALAIRWVEDNQEIVYAGKLDFPAEMSGAFYVVDHKCTTQWLTEFWASRYAYSHQMRGYVAMMQLLTGRKFAGVLINGVYMGKEAGDPKEKWAKRTSARSALFGPYVYPPALLKETHEWARTHTRLIDLYRKVGTFPQNDRACQFCEYKDLCRAHPMAREGLMRSNFVKRELTGILASGADSD